MVASDPCGLCKECHTINKLILSELQRLNDMFEAANGMPKSEPLVINANNGGGALGANVIYSGDKFPQPVTIRQIIVSSGSTGAITVWLLGDHYPGGKKAVWTGEVGGNSSVVFNCAIRGAAGSTLGVSTASGSATSLFMNAYYSIEPTTPQEFFVGRR